MLKPITLAAIGAVLVGGTLLAFGSDKSRDKKTMQGRWKVVAITVNGEKASQKIVDAAGYIISDNRLTPTVNGTERENSDVAFKLNEDEKPKQIDLVEMDDRKEKSIGIYELKGGRLRICFSKVPSKRPEKFESRPGGPARTLIILEKKK